MAFLATWLAKSVLPNSPIPPSVFHPAVRLGLKQKISLAAAATANIYHALNILQDRLSKAVVTKATRFHHVWAPLWMLQVWAWERFPALNSSPTCPITPASSIIFLRYEGKCSRTVVPEDIINNVINFVDRPYGTHLPGYIKPLLFNDREGERLVRPSNPAEDHEILDFVRIVTPGDLIAVITSEEKQHVPVVQYRPDRVAKQFGLDQGIPRVIPHNSDHEAAWYRFDMEPQFASILKPSKLQTGKDLPAYSKWASKFLSSFKTPPFSLSEVQGTRQKIGGKKRKGEVENVDVSAAGD